MIHKLITAKVYLWNKEPVKVSGRLCEQLLSKLGYKIAKLTFQVTIFVAIV